ncbi:MAG: MFS transporter [Xanthobacteraceae bacterium]|nr:MFS transporter [Xanthobacteraceae bacterium]
MLGWYRELGTAERRTFWACFGGWALDAFDVQIYSFVVPALIALWHITNAQAGLLATSALVISAFGGWIAGMLADRVGRARLLMAMVAWFAFFTFLSGFTQNFEQLLVVRGLQGFGFGGEWAAGSVLIGEVIRAQHRGKAVGTVQSAWAWGWGAAAILATVIFQVLPQEIAWRALFFLGISPALLVLYIRSKVPEPQIFQEATVAAARRSTFDIFRGDLLPTTILGAVLATGAQGGYYTITTFLPTFLRTQRHLTVLGTGGYLAVIIVGSWLGYIVSAYLSDAIGRRRNFFIFAIGSLLIAVAYTHTEISNSLMLELGFPLGFFASGIFSGMGPVLTELFPTSVRGAGQGFCYNFGRGIAAFFPTLVGMLSASVTLSAAIGAFAALAYAIVILAALVLPETRGKELVAD